MPANSARIVSLATVLAALLLSGCSDLIPGLHIRTGGQGVHQYSIVADDQKGGYEVTHSSELPSYQVVPVTPSVLKAVAREQQDGFTYALPTVLPSDVPPEYRIGPGDILYVTVWDHPELTQPTGSMNDISILSGQKQAQFVQGHLVGSDGTTFFPYVGNFKIAGMTREEAAQYIAAHLKSYIEKPQVEVRVVAFRANRVEVTGEVQNPGTINLTDMPEGVIQAINQSGGLTSTASRRRAILVRHDKTYVLDLAGLLSGDRPVGNPQLMPGDVLHIPDQSADQIFVLGGVGKQQPVSMLQSSMTLIQAVTASGGLNPTSGRQTGIIVFRMHRGNSDRPKASVYTIDLSNPSGVLMASAFQLEPRDVVYVPTTAFSQYNSVISELLPTVTTIFQLLEIHRLTK